jgi:membrane-associated phospholipid phosphatase
VAYILVHIGLPVLVAVTIGLVALSVAPGSVDQPLLMAVQEAAGQERASRVAWVFNEFFHFRAMPVLWTASAGFFWWRRRADIALLFVVAALVSPLNWLLKELFDRPRPSGTFPIYERPDGMSFPSGHVLIGAVFCGLWMVVAPTVARPSLAFAIRAAAVVVIAGTALARVWAAAHWPSDVVAGMFFAWAFVAGLWMLQPAAESAVTWLGARIQGRPPLILRQRWIVLVLATGVAVVAVSAR